MPSTIAAVTTSGGGVVTTADASGNLNLLAGTTTVVAITTAGVAVTGTLSATGITTVAAGTAALPSIVSTTGTADTGLWFPAADTVAASTAGAERMRIDSSGNVLINQTAATLGAPLQLTFDGSAQQGISIKNSANSASGAAVRFIDYLNNSSGGGIYYSSSNSISYTTSSDYRLKENVLPMAGALAKVVALKPVTFHWKIDGSANQGFIAHELAEIFPGAVVGKKDATWDEEYEVTPAALAVVDADGKETAPAVEAVKATRTVPSYQSVDTSFLVATLTAAIQELNAKFEAYKATHP